MKAKSGRYSVYIRPFTYAADLFVINFLTYALLPHVFFSLYFLLFISLSWVIIALNTGFYEVYRYTKVSAIFGKILRQFFIFTILCYAFSGFLIGNADEKGTLQYTGTALVLIATFKLFIFYFLRKYRSIWGGNFRRVVIAGNGKSVPQLAEFFNDNPDYGYKLVEVFDLDGPGDKKSKIDACFQFVKENKIDEIYCSLHELTENQVNMFVDFTDNNLKILKFLPDNRELLSRNFKVDYYDYIPVISPRTIPLDDPINKAIKRVFDIAFSAMVIALFLSWLTPLLAILIKLESKGPVFFKQRRNGLNYHEFNCFKFRSMRPNEIADLEQVSKNDPRITRIGKFMRKTSIDELPQFYNVLIGDMSVVGPRPHMVSHTEMYARRVDKFMVRHFVKPGITGLAQTNGFRGEVENDKDIIYRVKYDIFYMENWSLLLDMRIIAMTFINAVRGEEKAY